MCMPIGLRGPQFISVSLYAPAGDLKPGNLLVTRNCDLRITDFGLAREHPRRERSAAAAPRGLAPEGDEEERMTQHVVTRWSEH